MMSQATTETCLFSPHHNAQLAFNSSRNTVDCILATENTMSLTTDVTHEAIAVVNLKQHSGNVAYIGRKRDEDDLVPDDRIHFGHVVKGEVEPGVDGWLGNPFEVGDGKHDRDVSVAKFKQLMKLFFQRASYDRRQAVIYELEQLRGETLGCWCKPKACHGDVIRWVVENRKWDDW